MNKKIFFLLAVAISFFATSINAAANKISVAHAFYQLANQNNTQKIESLLHRGYSLESVDDREYNAVCISVIKQDMQAYKTLVSYGAKEKPRCLKKIPESVYNRFFGMYPKKAVVHKYTSDMPYKISAGVVGAGAIAAALLLKGSTGGGSGDDPVNPDNPPKPDNPEDPDEPKDPEVPDEPTCPENSRYNSKTKKCECVGGYGNYGDNSKCYESIPSCAKQNKDKCNKCEDGYLLQGNRCYRKINNCTSQSGDICDKCDTGYDTHGGNGKVCYRNIDKCEIQYTDECRQCINGYGTHGNSAECYKDIDHCQNQIQDMCKQCDTGYNTYGNPYKCYAENPCISYPHTVPLNDGNDTCVCDTNKGYAGSKENCTRSSDEEYKEGEGSKELWSDDNARYCNSHGTYSTDENGNGMCVCYTGYKNAGGMAIGCGACSDGYSMEFGGTGRCIRVMDCSEKGEGFIQKNDRCECDEGYLTYYVEEAEMKCGLIQGECATNHEEHYWNAENQAVECKCKPNFNEDCTECLEGFELTEDGDCKYIPKECEEKWIGDKCDVCPSQYKEEIDENGIAHCFTCADNRLPNDKNDEECSLCNSDEGYEKDSLTGGCIRNGCTQGVEGYIYDINGSCVCDELNNYFRNSVGECQQKEPDLVGTYNNVNNSNITLINDGVLRDVYGMKPIMYDEDGNEIKDEYGKVKYYDNVYNAQAVASSQIASIDIKNNNSGENKVYGIYSDSVIYNASVFNSIDEDLSAEGTINIEDTSSDSTIYGIYNLGENSTYNSFALSENENTKEEPSESQSTATITIVKDKLSSGDITALYGNGDIYNAASITSNGTGANVSSIGVIDIKNSGNGDAIGIEGNAKDKRIINAVAYMDSAVSNAVASGEINVESDASAYGIKSNGTVINSETQFRKKYNVLGEKFESLGEITVTSNSELSKSGAYGIYIKDGSEIETEVYNAMGLNSKGIITINSTAGSSAYGIYSKAETYQEEKDGKKESYYNNVYNSFRSSAIYGGDNVFSEGEIKLNISGRDGVGREAIGIYSGGNAFNAYANSGSDVRLNTIGTININDASQTSDITLKGIEGRGNLIANAYAFGTNKNTTTHSIGSINITTKTNKNGQQDKIYGIYNGAPSSQESYIYNAAVIDDNSTADGKINITSEMFAVNEIYGIYASNDDAKGGEEGGENKRIYNAYYSLDTDKYQDYSGGKVSGEINIKSTSSSKGSDAKYYGMYIKDGYAYNAYNNNEKGTVSGKINIDVVGGQTGEAVGMYGVNANLNNSGDSEIKVSLKATQNKAYGMKGINSHIINNALIDVYSKEYEAYGIYADKGSVINEVNGVIKVEGKSDTYGIYAISGKYDGEEVSVINRGTIELNGKGNNIGIYASGSKATIENTGTIKINGAKNEVVCDNGNCDKNVAIKLENNATLLNNGVFSSDGDINLGDMGGEVVLGASGKFVAEEDISGDLQISTNMVTNTFDKETSINNALTADSIEDLNILSNSYMYNASTSENADGTFDVVMSMKDLSSINDENMASYYKENYDNENNLELFNVLKNAKTQSEYNQVEADISGASVIPNIAQEELKVARSLDTKLMTDLFESKDQDIRRMVGADNMYVGRDDMGTLTGYDIMSQSMYALYDKKLNNNYRLGLGLSFTHTDTDYNNDSTRKNFMVQGYVPLTYTNARGLTAVSMARLGYSDGDYKRYADNKSFEADINGITYGLLNELRYTINANGIKVTPFVGLNAIGWYQDKIDEGDSNLALDVASSHVFSLESALGLYLDKDIEFNHDNKLNMALGLGYYHEFANPYKGMDARHHGSEGGFKLRHRKLNNRDRGILSAKVNYDYKDFSIYGELMQYLEDEYPIKVDVGLKYKF